MPSILTLQDGALVRTGEDAQPLAARFNASRRDGTLIKVDADEGAIWVNPHALITIKACEAPD